MVSSDFAVKITLFIRVRSIIVNLCFVYNEDLVQFVAHVFCPRLVPPSPREVFTNEILHFDLVKSCEETSGIHDYDKQHLLSVQ